MRVRAFNPSVIGVLQWEILHLSSVKIYGAVPISHATD